MKRVNGQLTEVDEFIFLGSILCNYTSMDRKKQERTPQEVKVMRSLGHRMKGKPESMEVKRHFWIA